jgi:hypothetical protein
MSDLRFGLIGASYVAATRMVPAFEANGITTGALFDTDEQRFRHWRDHDLELLTTKLGGIPLQRRRRGLHLLPE